jgi:lipoprotein-releasing system permease protein
LGAIEIRRVKPLTETRGIRGYPQILEGLRTLPALRASPVLAGQALVSFAGKDIAVSLNGMIPAEVNDVSTIQNYMIAGSVDANRQSRRHHPRRCAGPQALIGTGRERHGHRADR